MSTKQHTVMVVDDQADLLRMYAAALKEKYNVMTANSGKSCLEKYMEHKLRGKKVDVMLLDYRLGDSFGDDIACKIRDLNGTKVIMITAYELEYQMVKELRKKNCIVDLVQKPITIRSLLEKVHEVLSAC